MRCPKLSELPPPPPGKTGWPWTEETSPLPDTMPDGGEWPKISIVTPNYNYGRFIEETIRSVLLQGYPNLEYIVIDGGSTDDSVEIIKKYEPWLSYWVSEKDKGQSNAINKGFRKVNGQIVNWLCSDDIFLQSTFTEIASSYNSKLKIIVGITDFEYVETGSRFLMIPNYFPLNQDIFKKFQIPQPSCFICNLVPELLENLHYVMDWELQFRLLRTTSSEEILFKNMIFAYSPIHPGCKSAGNGDAMKYGEIIKLQYDYSRNLPFPTNIFSLLKTYREHSLLEFSKSNPRSIFSIIFFAFSNPIIVLSRFYWGAIKKKFQFNSL